MTVAEELVHSLYRHYVIWILVYFPKKVGTKICEML